MKIKLFQDEQDKASQGSGGAQTLQPSPKQSAKSRFNLQIKLPLVVFSLLLLSFLGVTILSVNASKSILIKTLQGNLETEASLQAESIRSHLTWTRSMAIDLSTVAKALDLDQETSKVAIAQMLYQNEQVVGSTIAYEPYMFNPDLLYWAPYYSRASDGTLHFAQLGTPEYNYPKQDWYKLAKDAEKIILSPPYFDEGGGNIWMVTWSVPFHDNSGKFRGVATADIAFSQTQEIVRQITVGQDGYAFLVDRNGIILGIGNQGGQYKIMEDSLLTANPPQEMVAWNNLINEMTQGNSGFTNITDPTGKAMFVFYRPIGMDTGWSLGLAYPQEELFQPAVELQNTLISLSVTVLVITSIVLFFFSRTITRPLQRITSWARLMSQQQTGTGNYQSLPPLQIHTNDEIEDLADTFNHVSTELTLAFSTLEQRVQERTKALSSVAEVSTATSTILETDKLLQQVVDLTKERFDFYHAHIYLLNKTGDTLVLASGAGEPGRKMVAEGRSIPFNRERSLVARAAREKKGVIANDVTIEPDFLPNPLLPDTHSELAVPMIVGEQVIGVFDVQSEVVGRFTDADVSVQTTLASQVASAVQNAILYTQAENSALEAQSLVENAPEAIVVVDLETGLFTNPNENAVNLYGLSREELVKVGPAQMSPPTQPDGRNSTEKAMEKIGEALQGGKPVFEWMHRNGQGDDFLCEVRLVNMPGAQPRVRASVTDIHERKRIEELTRRRAQQQEALNLITQKIQNAATIESALQVAARELGHALGMKPTAVTLEAEMLPSDPSSKRGFEQG